MGDLTGVYESGRFKGIPCNEDVPESILEQLVQNAHDAKLNAYAIYSNFRVGAAVLSSSGVIYQGCNVENSSYGLTVCAERCAVFKAANNGERKLIAVVVTSDITDKFTYPCGACRQVLSEFSTRHVYCLKPNGDLAYISLSELLPHAFGPDSLH